jgi:hypothetical protein
VIERWAKATCRGSRKPLSFVAFYADCHHQVRPVLAGFRVVLTYDLMLAGEPGAPDAAFPAANAMESSNPAEFLA